MKKTFKLGSKQKTITRTLASSRESIQFIKQVTVLQENVIMDPFAEGYKESEVTELELNMMALYAERASELLEQPEDYFENLDYFDIVDFVQDVQEFLSQQGESGKKSGED